MKTIYFNNYYLLKEDLLQVAEIGNYYFVKTPELYKALCDYFDKVRKDHVSRQAMGIALKKWGFKFTIKRFNKIVCRCVIGLRLTTKE